MPQTIDAPSIKFTGRRFSPKVLTTDKIIFTGRRFSSKTISTDQIVFTGRRFSPKAVDTPAILFTGRGYGTTIDISKIKEGLKTGQEGKADILKTGKLEIGVQKAMSGKSQAGPGGESLKETKSMKVATLTPVKPVAKLAFKGHKIFEILNKVADKPFDLVFPVINSGEGESGPVKYSITCRVLSGGGKCPPFKSPATLPALSAKSTKEIVFRGLRFKPGLYEIAVSLKVKGAGMGPVKRVRLKITSATGHPKTFKAFTPEADAGNKGGSNKPQIKRLTPLKPTGDKPSHEEKPLLRFKVR